MSGVAQKPTLEHLNQAPEEDLDDLDDVLDQFNTATPKASSIPLFSPPPPPPTAATNTTFNRPRTNTRVDEPPKSIPGTGPFDPASEADEDAISADFAKELAKGMEDLMEEIAAGTEPAGGKEGGQTDEEAAKAFKAAWEAMLVDGLDGDDGVDPLAGLGELLGMEGLGPSAKGKGKAKSTAPGQGQQPPAGGSDFQSTIKQAMDKLKESEANLMDADPSLGPDSAADPESMEALLASLGDMGDLGLGDGAGGAGDLLSFFETIIGQLFRKDILYEPLKELVANFPGYFANPPAPIEPADKERYDKLLDCSKRVVAEFEKPDYSDDSHESNRAIVTLMNEMQSYGPPPKEILGELPETFGTPSAGKPDCVIA